MADLLSCYSSQLQDLFAADVQHEELDTPGFNVAHIRILRLSIDSCNTQYNLSIEQDIFDALEDFARFVPAARLELAEIKLDLEIAAAMSAR